MKKKSLMIVHPSRIRGGCEEYAFTIAASASRAGWRVYGAFPRTEGVKTMIRDLQALEGGKYFNLQISEIPGTKSQNRWNVFKRFLKSLVVLLRTQPDVCLLAFPTVQYMAGTIYACSLLRIPAMLCFQYVHVFPYEDGCFPFPPWMLRRHSAARTRGQQYVAISENNRQPVARNFGMSEEDIEVIYNGASESFAAIPEPERREMRAKIRRDFAVKAKERVMGFSEERMIDQTLAVLDRLNRWKKSS